MSQQVSISLEKDHIRAVERYGKKIGVTKFSVILQAIIHQFDAQQKAAEKDQAAQEAAAQTQPA